MQSGDALRTIGLLALAAGFVVAAVVLSPSSIAEFRILLVLCGVLLLTGMMVWVGERQREEG